MKRLVVAKRASQTVFLITFIYILWSTTYPLKGLLPPDTFFKINPLIMVITSISERVLLPGFIFSVLMIILTLALGRFFCGWVCPLGAVIDGAATIKKSKHRTDNADNRKLKPFKFVILLIITIFAVLGTQIAWVFDPMVIMARFVSLNFIPAATFIMDQFFILLIKGSGFYGPVVDLYHGFKSSVLGIKVYYFSHSLVIFLFFFLICISTFLSKRFWCRNLCPLGALYALCAKFARLGRVVQKCGNCRICKSRCRMGAINDDITYVKQECILCMDCVYDCPQNITKFNFASPRKSISPKDNSSEDKSGINRRQFLILSALSFFSMGASPKNGWAWKGKGIIRPPAALNEPEFLDRCIRCGNCMKVCLTNGLQPALLQSGLEGIWTPHLVPEIGYCEYKCTLCGNVCPTGAIPRLTMEKKQKVKLGLAEINRKACIPWIKEKECIVCEEHCPVPKKAITLKRELSGSALVFRPYIDEELCIGCAICQTKCPVTPERAIKVFPRGADRT